MSIIQLMSQNPFDSDFNEDSQNLYDSEEDTDDASETEITNQRYGNISPPAPPPATTVTVITTPMMRIGNNNAHELKEQVYQQKLAALNKQLDDLKNLEHSEYVKRLRKLESQYRDRIRLNDVYREYLRDCAEKDYILERKAAHKEYEEKKMDLKDNILADLEERRKVIENERYSLELTNDSTEIKPTITRKLRRRPNDPAPIVEKRRKPTTGQLLIYLLEDKEIENDLKAIQRCKPISSSLQNGINSYNNNNHNHVNTLNDSSNQLADTRIEDGKLWYEKRWYHRGQQIYVECREMPKTAATITAIGSEVVWVKKVNDSKFKIQLSHLIKNKITIRRRAN